MDIQSQVTKIISGTMNLSVSSPDADLVASGQLDSLALVDLLMHLESSFGIAVALDGVEIDDFRSVSRIAGLVGRYLKAA
jgi:methoxymalonate biosynthesis acyl carrier protein